MNYPAGLSVRPLEERDLEPLAKELGLSQHHIADRWRERQAGQRTTLIGDVDRCMAGSVSFDEQDAFADLLHLFALGVVPREQRRGIGTKLIEAVENEAIKRQLSGVYLAVAIDNADAIRLYERLGYERTGEPYTARWTWHGVSGDTREVVERCLRLVKRRET